MDWHDNYVFYKSKKGELKMSSNYDLIKNALKPGQAVDPNQIPDDIKEEVKCKKCGGDVFIQITKFTKVKQDPPIYIPAATYICIGCQEILPDHP